jgi:hypothetical protein
MSTQDITLQLIAATNDTTNSTNDPSTQQRTQVPRMTDSMVEAHMAEGSITDNGLNLYPIRRKGLTTPLFATITEANLTKDVTLDDNIYTRAQDKTFTYESYQDKADLPRGKDGRQHFTEEYQCRRCKGYGHYFQRCLQAEK